jgi:hypothetical protein
MRDQADWNGVPLTDCQDILLVAPEKALPLENESF